MYVIVVGAGQVGYHLARRLISQQHEVTVIESDVAKCDALVDEFGDRIVPGNGARLSVLHAAGAERADVLVAATGQDENNLVVAQVAQHLGVKRVIARVNNPLNVPIFNRLGIRLTVSASQVLADVINQEVVSEQVRTLLAFPSGDLELVTLDLPTDTPWRGRSIASLRWPEGTRPVAVVRQGHALVAAEGVVLEGGDRLVLVAVPEKTPVLQQLLTGRAGARIL